MKPKYPEVKTTGSFFSLPSIIITHSLPLGITKEECFARIVKKGVPACCMWVRGSTHPSGTAERGGGQPVSDETELVTGPQMQNGALILTQKLCKLE